MRKKTFSFLAFVLSLSIYFSCIDEGVEVSGLQRINPDSDLLSYAMNLVGENGEGCSLIDLRKGSTNSRAVTDYSTIATPLWEKAKTERHGDEEVLIVPLQGEDDIYSSMYFEEEEMGRLYQTKSFSRLVVRSKNGHTVTQVFTYLPGRNYAKNRQAVLDSMGFSPLAVKYYGTILISDLEGKFQQGFYYERGVPTIHLTPKKHTHTIDSRAINDSTECDDHKHSHAMDIRLKLSGNMRIASRSMDEGEEIDMPCMFCGQSALNCTCFIVDGNYVYCDDCGKLKGECICSMLPTCPICNMLVCVCTSYVCDVCGNVFCICNGTGPEPDQGCKYCGKTDCNGRCQNTGPSIDEPKDTIASKAKTIFRNSNMTEENWRIIERMLDKITADCLGENLYNGLKYFLNGGTLTIQFKLPGETGGGFGTDENGNIGIVLDQEMKSNQLFHEMMHAYRAYNETASSYKSSTINGEIEAFYAQYLYISRLPEYENSEWEADYYTNPIKLRARILSDYLDNKGNLRNYTNYNKLKFAITNFAVYLKTHGVYQDDKYKYDSSREILSNFNNLRNLTIDCL